jgi:hypothetical protein
MAAAEDDGWSTLELRVPGGPPAAARVLEVLVTAGLPVARFERVQLSLAQLIERVQRKSREESHA